jgi:hypothetical protein
MQPNVPAISLQLRSERENEIITKTELLPHEESEMIQLALCHFLKHNYPTYFFMCIGLVDANDDQSRSLHHYIYSQIVLHLSSEAKKYISLLVLELKFRNYACFLRLR